MIARVEKTAQGFVIPVSEEMVQRLKLTDGAAVEVNVLLEAGAASIPEIRYATVEEALSAFEETLPRHENSYRELAK